MRGKKTLGISGLLLALMLGMVGCQQQQQPTRYTGAITGTLPLTLNSVETADYRARAVAEMRPLDGTGEQVPHVVVQVEPLREGAVQSVRVTTRILDMPGDAPLTADQLMTLQNLTGLAISGDGTSVTVPYTGDAIAVPVVLPDDGLGRQDVIIYGYYVNPETSGGIGTGSYFALEGSTYFNLSVRPE